MVAKKTVDGCMVTKAEGYQDDQTDLLAFLQQTPSPLGLFLGRPFQEPERGELANPDQLPGLGRP